MSSQVLARKYRPQDFDAVVGQDTTVQILKNALVKNRLHHAYLFSGPRGIGKTTLARIFAKAVNCGKGPTGEPCNQCTSCIEITEGKSLSAMEIDGASNTSVDDIRDLREKIYYLPPGGRYKIYIIDEVHMLSTAAFNALLKTLEEPPAHALFLFATTEPQKVPLTVLSRVMRFDLRAIPRGLIASHLKKIAGQESIQVDEEALFLIAREAQGGLRDALGLFDQIVSFTGTKITLKSVEEIVGVSTRRFVLRLLEAILDRQGGEALKVVREAFTLGVEVKRMGLDLLEYLRHLLVLQATQDPLLFDLPQEEINDLAMRAKGIETTDLDRIFRMLQKGILDLLRSPVPQISFDTLILRLCSYEKLRPVDELVRSLASLSTTSPQISSSGGRVAATSPSPTTSPRKTETFLQNSQNGWGDFLKFLQSKKPQLYAMISQCSLKNQSDSEISILLPQKSMTGALLQDPERLATTRALLNDFFGHPMNLVYHPWESDQKSPASIPSGGKFEQPQIVEDALAVFGPNTVKMDSGRGSL